MPPLRHSPAVEAPEEDEQAIIDGIAAAVAAQTETVEAREGRAGRASHAKSTACALGTLAVAEGLPPELAQGLFARAGSFDVAVRFAQGSGETLGDRVSTHRGMAIKVFGPPGETSPGTDEGTRDVVPATGRTFASGPAGGFLRDGAAFPEGAKSAASSARTLNRVLRAAGAESARAEFFGHPVGHPFADGCFSQAPLRWDGFVAKVDAFPASPAQEAMRDWRLNPRRDEDGFRAAAVAHLRAEEVVHELRAQPWTDARTQPIEDASVERPEAESPRRTAATIRLPRQEALGEDRARLRRAARRSPRPLPPRPPAPGLGDAGAAPGLRGAPGRPPPQDGPPRGPPEGRGGDPGVRAPRVGPRGDPRVGGAPSACPVRP